MKRILIFLFVFTACQLYAANAYFITVDGVITKTTHNYIKKGIDTAANDIDASFIVIKLDTPGGMLNATRSIVKDILESPIPVVVYVSPAAAEAGSAGTFITLAGDYAFMTETSTIGAAHPVQISGSDIEGDMREKAVNSTESFVRMITEKRGRNTDIAILTVTESKSLTAKEALEANLIDGIINSDAELMDTMRDILNIDSGINKIELKPKGFEKLIFLLSSPDIMVILLLLGLVFIFLEIKAPGTFVFAGIGIVFIILFMLGANIVPVNFLGLLLILTSIALFVAELFVTSFGLLTLAGIVCYVVGIRILFNTGGSDGVKVSIAIILVTCVLIISFVLFVLRLVVKDFKRKSNLGLYRLNEKTGTVMNWESGSGQVQVYGEIWNATGDKDIKPGDKVKVVSTEGLMANVEKLNDKGDVE